MFGSMKVLSVIAGLGLVAGLMAMPVRAETARETGSVSGTVVDAAGNAVAGATVALMDRSQMPEGPKRDAKAVEAEAKPKRPEATAKATTDAEGKFSLAEVPVGEYAVVARAREGTARGKVTVTAGQEARVELTLKANGGKDKKKKGE